MLKEMNSDNHKLSNMNNISLLNEADELARSQKWTRDLALYTMYSQAMKRGDKIKAKACMELLEKEVMNLLSDASFWRPERGIDRGS